MGIAIALLLGFIGVEAVGYLLHRLMHARWTGPLHRSHMNHHLIQYPPKDYLSDSYRRTGTDSTTRRFFIAGVILAIITALVFPLWFAAPILLNMAVVGWLNSYIHDSTHIRGHWLERFGFFHKLRATHEIHHNNMKKNFGIVTFITDRLFGTYRKIFPVSTINESPP